MKQHIDFLYCIKHEEMDEVYLLNGEPDFHVHFQHNEPVNCDGPFAVCEPPDIEWPEYAEDIQLPDEDWMKINQAALDLEQQVFTLRGWV